MVIFQWIFHDNAKHKNQKIDLFDSADYASSVKMRSRLRGGLHNLCWEKAKFHRLMEDKLNYVDHTYLFIQDHKININSTWLTTASSNENNFFSNDNNSIWLYFHVLLRVYVEVRGTHSLVEVIVFWSPQVRLESCWCV